LNINLNPGSLSARFTKEIRLDNRAANSMDSKTLESHTQLERHAQWAKENFNGWSSKTLLGRFEEEGNAIFSRSTRPPISIPPDIALTDKALTQLGEIDTKVLRAYYDYWEATEVLARRVRMRKPEFLNVLRRARWRFGLHRDSLPAEA
jgi:hypothetical protein